MEARLDRLERLCPVSPAEVLEELKAGSLDSLGGRIWRVFGLRGSCHRLLGQYSEAESAFAVAILASVGEPGAETDLCRRAARLHADRGEISSAISLATRACRLAESAVAEARARIDLAAIFCSTRSELKRACRIVGDAKRLLDGRDPYLAYAEQIELFCWAESNMSHLTRSEARARLDGIAALIAPSPGSIGYASLMWLTGVVFRRTQDFEEAFGCFEQARLAFGANRAWPQTTLCVVETVLTARRAGQQAAHSTEVGRLFPLVPKLQGHDRIEATRLLRAAANGTLSLSDLERSQHVFALR